MSPIPIEKLIPNPHSRIEAFVWDSLAAWIFCQRGFKVLRKRSNIRSYNLPL